jgi:hypothetical protein
MQATVEPRCLQSVPHLIRPTGLHLEPVGALTQQGLTTCTTHNPARAQTGSILATLQSRLLGDFWVITCTLQMHMHAGSLPADLLEDLDDLLLYCRVVLEHGASAAACRPVGPGAAHQGEE